MAEGADGVVVRQRVAVVLRAGDAVLLIHRWRDAEEYFVVPGGGVEPGETVEEAARREMREEASVEILGELLPLISFEGVDERHGVVQRFVAFTAEAWSGDVEMSDAAPEASTASASNRYQLEWVDLASLAALDLQPVEVKNALLALASQTGRVRERRNSNRQAEPALLDLRSAFRRKDARPGQSPTHASESS